MVVGSIGSIFVLACYTLTRTYLWCKNLDHLWGLFHIFLSMGMAFARILTSRILLCHKLLWTKFVLQDPIFHPCCDRTMGTWISSRDSSLHSHHRRRQFCCELPRSFCLGNHIPDGKLFSQVDSIDMELHVLSHILWYSWLGSILLLYRSWCRRLLRHVFHMIEYSRYCHLCYSILPTKVWFFGHLLLLRGKRMGPCSKAWMGLRLQMGWLTLS